MPSLNASSENRLADSRAAWRICSEAAAVSGELIVSRAEAKARAYSSGVVARYPTTQHNTKDKVE